MSHISGEAVRALMCLTEARASDDAIIALDFEGKRPSVQVKDEDGKPLRLGQLRELAEAFKVWFE